MKKHDINIGDVFGKLTVSGCRESIKGRSHVECKCLCGETVNVRTDRLVSKNTKSCGCINKIKAAKGLIAFKNKKSKEKMYFVWMAMINRCHSKNNPGYKNYGARGIKVCEKWRNSYDSFVQDLGDKPFDKAQIDRIDNDGNYEPSNVRWTTSKVNRNNQRPVKLSREDVQVIKTMLLYKKHSQTKISKLFSVSKTLITEIKKGRSWQDVYPLPI